ncbi:putative trehalose synthase [Labedella gwakjiensis]|uniref:Maltokinase n=1 Tax=Labedella gwakjiensis TaxID=390269 RepID=A0A2P8GS55_9MICO|nr:phosphotransferase [Labedella gwakjiensis]PSL36803.1 putative trehalose synthase [Labedella gwakjiensis]RUQ84313.1 phosphotransferase [Labedella gwakjiensis]
MSVVAPVLAQWMARQRWYQAKGAEPALRIVGTLDGGTPGVRVATFLLLDEAAAEPLLYQVPVAFRAQPLPEAQSALIGEVDGRYLYDAPHDPAYVDLLLRTISEGGRLEGADASATGHPSADPGTAVSSHVFSGEQSNTSIVVEVDGGPVPQVIVKLFRLVHHGENPDVTLQTGISAAGSDRVPRSFGVLTGSWPDPGRADGVAVGHLAAVQEFLPGSEDAWRVALRAAASGEDFTGRAAELGEAVAEVHETLADVFPTVPTTPADIADAVALMRSRLAMAANEVPALLEHREEIDAVYERATRAEWPAQQRVHGDLHLGQVLWTDARGWVIIDFEGEPLRPMSERSRPDIALRDVAGMLRSFDYVAGSLGQDGSSDASVASAWAAAGRDAFITGYGRRSGVDLASHQVVLDAFELDKAVYETLYEARNRPAWLGIPLAAVARLVTPNAG